MEKERKMLKRNKGITLIALVITIIVLLILASVSIAMLTGENGILTQATNAKEKTQEAEDKEKIQIAINEAQISNSGYQKLTEENLQKEIDEQFGSGIVRVYPNEKNAFSFIFQNKESNYRLEKDGTLNKIDITLKINNVEEFRNFMNEVNSGNTFQDQYVYLLENIDLENQEWDVIGSYTDDTTNNAFSGIFEGNNRTINGLNISKNQDYVGLFAYNTGIIRDIILESGNISGNCRVSGISAINTGIIENCHNNGVKILATGADIGAADQKVVVISGIVANCLDGKIIHCSNSVDITNEIGGYVAGIVADLRNGNVSECYNTGNITGVFDVGGIAAQGKGNTIIEKCYNNGNVTGTGKNQISTFSGGISGSTVGTIRNCYNTGTIESADSRCGGISGSFGVEENLNASIYNCYNIGKIQEIGIALGNIAAAYGGSVKNCYFSKEITNIEGVFSTTGNTVIEVYDKSLNYMKTSNFVKDLNKDEDVFTINSSLNNGYPVLKWQVE